MFYIVKVCCFSCNKFESFKICPTLNYKKFIKNNYNDYKDYTYYIFDSESRCVDTVEFY